MASQAPEAAAEELRCQCNRLVCMIREGSIIEIKCGKCKRVIRIHTRGITKISGV